MGNRNNRGYNNKFTLRKVLIIMEKKKIRLSIQKKFIFIPFSVLLISVFMSINVGTLTIKESFYMFIRLVPVIMINFICIIFLDFINISDDIEMIAICILVYISHVVMSLILIKYQKKMGIKE